MLSWNTRELTLASIQSLYDNPAAVPFEVVVVDNGSADGSADAIAARFPQVTLVRSDRNLGYGPGNNLAYDHARGRTLLLLGSDTVMEPGTLDGLLACLQAHPEAGAASCRVMLPDGAVDRTCLGFPDLRDLASLYTAQNWLVRHATDRGFDYYATQPVEQVAGTCLLLKRELVERIGLFDEAYKILYTDVELCQRIHDAGEQIIYTGAISLVHYSSQSCKIARGPVRTQMYLDTARYSRSRFGRASLALMLPILGLRLALVNKGRGVTRLVGRSLLAPLPEPSFGNTRSGR